MSYRPRRSASATILRSAIEAALVRLRMLLSRPSAAETTLFETYLINVSTTLLMEGITSIDSV